MTEISSHLYRENSSHEHHFSSETMEVKLKKWYIFQVQKSQCRKHIQLLQIKVWELLIKPDCDTNRWNLWEREESKREGAVIEMKHTKFPCCSSPNTKESKRTATTPTNNAASNSGNVHLYSCHIVAKGQGKYQGMVTAAMGYRGQAVRNAMAFLRQVKKQRKWTSPHIVPSGSTCMVLRGFKVLTPL